MKPYNFILTLTLLALASVPSHADDVKVSKEREALRRAQSALRTATEQQQTLQADKTQLQQEKDKLEKSLTAARGLEQVNSARLKAATQRAEALENELQASKQAQQMLQSGSQLREQELQQQLLAARRESAEHLQSARALTALLEHSTQALADAETKNHQLYAVGQELIQRYLGRSKVDVATLGDPFLGLSAVKLEDQAEQMRSQLEAQRIR